MIKKRCSCKFWEIRTTVFCFILESLVMTIIFSQSVLPIHTENIRDLSWLQQKYLRWSYFFGDVAWLQNLLKKFSLTNTSEELLLHFQLHYDCKMQPFKCNIIFNKYYYKNFIMCPILTLYLYSNPEEWLLWYSFYKQSYILYKMNSI